MEKVTTDKILTFLQEAVETKKNVPAEKFADAAIALNILLGDEEDLSAELYQQVAKLKLSYLEAQEKKNVSEAKLKVEASDEYKVAKKQEMKGRQRLSRKSEGFVIKIYS